MIFFNQFSALALTLPFVVTSSLSAMENTTEKVSETSFANTKSKKRKREFLDGPEILGQGHQGQVTKASPMKASPIKKKSKKESTEEVGAVRKTLFSCDGGDLEGEAQIQITIREALRKENENLIRHIPKIAAFDRTYIKMAEASGATIKDVFLAISPEGFLALMKNVMYFISVMHKLGYAHEDLSPANILVDPTDIDNFTIIDFELSGLIGKSKRRMTAALGYSAPEVSYGNVVGPEADVFSIGKILKEYFKNYSTDKELYELIGSMTKSSKEERIGLKEATASIDEMLRDLDLNYRFVGEGALVKETEVKGYVIELEYDSTKI